MKYLTFTINPAYAPKGKLDPEIGEAFDEAISYYMPPDFLWGRNPFAEHLEADQRTIAHLEEVVALLKKQVALLRETSALQTRALERFVARTEQLQETLDERGVDVIAVHRGDFQG